MPALRAVVRARDDLVHQRVATANRLEACLDAYWPGAKRLFCDIVSNIALAFLEDYPTPASAARVGERRTVVCLVIDDETLRYRLATRTTNAFGKDPVELAIAVAANRGAAARCRHYGATIIDSTQPVDGVVRDLLAAVAK